MIIEKSGFLLMAGTLAAGGIGGWMAHDAKTHGAHPMYGESTASVTRWTRRWPPSPLHRPRSP